MRSFKAVVKEEGFRGLWRGNTVNVLRMIPNKVLVCAGVCSSVLECAWVCLGAQSCMRYCWHTALKMACCFRQYGVGANSMVWVR